MNQNAATNNATQKDTMESCDTIQHERLTTLREACSKIRQNHNSNVTRWARSSLSIVLEKEKAVYCFIPKVACSSWKLKIMSERGLFPPEDYTGEDTVHHDWAMQRVLAQYGIKTLSQYSSKQAKNILETYFKFLFVRDPLERLLSGYRDKLLHKNSYYQTIQKAIINKSSNKSRQYPEFHEFLNHIFSGGVLADDIHWSHYIDVCNPCQVNYNFVGKLDSLKQDVNCILPRLGMGPWFPFPTNPRSSEDKVKKYFSKLPQDIRDKSSKKWHNDIRAFGYKTLEEKGITSKV